MPPTALFSWSSPDLPRELTVDCFLPTGVLVPLQCKVTATLAEIKTRLFETARDYPLFNRLEGKTVSDYCFLCINEKGKRETLLDETLKLTDVRPFRPVLKLLELQGDDKGDSKLDAKIKFLMRKTPAELDGKNDEVLHFREEYLRISIKESRERRESSWEERATSTYPSDICTDSLPEYILKKLHNGKFDINVYLPPGDDHERLEIPLGINPCDVVYVFRNRSEKRKQSIANDKDYVLKIVGKEDYLLGNYNMENFKYIRECIAREIKPELSVVPRSTMIVEDYAPMVADEASPPPIPPKTFLTVWDINARFKFKITSATNISIEGGTEIGVRAGLFHGSILLCPVKCSREKQGPSPVWNEYLEFEISMCDIPRMAKLCLTIYAKRKKATPLAWVNMTLFDFRNYLRQGQIKLHAWQVKENVQDLNPIGTVVSNINTSTSPCLIIEFTQYAKPGTSVVYPPFDKVLEKASTLAGNEKSDIFRDGEKTNIDLEPLTQREPLAEYTDEDRKKIWFFRFECRDKFPNSLAKVLLSIQWNNHEDVARLQALLQCWPLVAPERALELLDYKYPEKEIRDYAVRCLEKFSRLPTVGLTFPAPLK